MRKAAIKSLRSLYSLSVRWEMPRLSAVLLILLTQRLTKVPRRYRVLCLKKPIFLDDVRALDKYGTDVAYLLFPRLLLGEIVKHYVPFSDFNDKTYHVDAKFKEGQLKARVYIRKMMPLLRWALKFDAVFSGNYVFLSQQEFFAVCQEMNVPIAVLYKEGMYPRKTLSDCLKDIHYENTKSFADKIFFYNDHINAVVNQAGVNGITAEKSSTVGIPRLDFYIKASGKNGSNRQIVLFTFDPKTKVAFLGTEKAKVDEIVARSEEFHRMAMEFAVRHPEYKVVVKTKGAAGSLDYAADIWKRHFSARHKALPNLEITDSKDARALILDSEFVLGYNSTTQLEAILAGKPVLSPFFGDLAPGIDWDYFQNYPDLVHYVNNYRELEDMVIHRRGLKQPPADVRTEFLEQMVYKMDGEASLRTEKELVSLIESNRRIAHAAR